MGLCDFCGSGLSYPIAACKCGQLRFCTPECHKSGMKTHKYDCPAFQQKKTKQTGGFAVPHKPDLHASTPPEATPPAAIPPAAIPPAATPPAAGPHASTPPARVDYQANQASDKIISVQPRNFPATSVNSVSADADSSVENTSSNTSLASFVGDQEDISLNRTGARKRDALGHFKENPDKDVERSNEQKDRDKNASKVSKCKNNIVEQMKKLQEYRPEVSQTYLLESQVRNSIKNPVVYKTTGIVSSAQTIRLLVDSASAAVDQEDDADIDQEDETIAELGSVNPQESERLQTGRLYEKLCFVCKLKVGSVHNQRIVCRIKECTRGAAHLACVNFRPSSAAALSILRSNYCCPRHTQDVENVLEGDEEAPEEGAGGDDRARSGRKAAGQAKNSNLLRPQKLSPLLMDVLGTQQMYQSMNELRRLFKAYIQSKKLQQENGLTLPDARLALVTGVEAFKMAKIVSVLRKGKNIS